MTKKEALVIIDNIIAQVCTTPANHAQIALARNVLAADPVPEVPPASPAPAAAPTP